MSVWAWAQVGLGVGPCRSGPKSAWAQVGLGPSRPGPKSKQSGLKSNRSGPKLVWAQIGQAQIKTRKESMFVATTDKSSGPSMPQPFITSRSELNPNIAPLGFLRGSRFRGFRLYRFGVWVFWAPAFYLTLRKIRSGGNFTHTGCGSLP